jgi:hypothetical protein
MTKEAVERSFDELAIGLSSGSLSRGKALRLMGAALVGGALASIPGIAWAKPKKPEGTKCNHNHQCASEQCLDGRCVLGGSTCDGEICGALCCTADESCWSDGTIGQVAICCSNDPYCVGVVTVAGQQVCVNGAAYDDCAHPTCNIDADCSSGELCVPTFCDPENRCVPAC